MIKDKQYLRYECVLSWHIYILLALFCIICQIVRATVVNAVP